MKIYNIDKTKLLDVNELDFNKGYLKTETIVVPEIKAVEKQSHYEIVKVYDNGGQDVKEIVDVEGVDYQPEHEETIQIYTPYSTEELKKIEYNKELIALKIDWFDGYYTEHEQKYRRLHTLGLMTDEGKDPYTALTELYAEAETKRKRIQELEELLGNDK